MDLELFGKVAVVTGASRGIGAAIADRLVREGCRTALIARDEAMLHDVARRLDGPFSKATLPIACDVTSPDDIVACVGRIADQLGGIDILVNNAGGFVTEGPAPFEALTDAHFLASYELNFLSCVRFSRAVLPFMAEAGWGRIISISSEVALQPDPVGADYSAAKAALNVFSKALSISAGPKGIRVNVVAPAFIKTPLVEGMIAGLGQDAGLSFDEAEAMLLQTTRPHISTGRPGNPSDVAAAVAFLASRHAEHVNGTVLRVDGGSVAYAGG